MHTFTQPTLFVLGNHEMDAGNEKKLVRFRDMAEGSTVTILENDVWEQAGVCFLGCILWTPGNRRKRAAMRHSIAWLREMLGKAYTGTTVQSRNCDRSTRRRIRHDWNMRKSFQNNVERWSHMADPVGRGSRNRGNLICSKSHPDRDGHYDVNRQPETNCTPAYR
jgi:hypothetical protein